MKNSILFILCLSFFTLSCKKEKIDNTPQETINYAKLKVGNFWVYDVYKVYVDGTEEFYKSNDTCYIEKDTIIEGKTFYKYCRPYILSSGIDRSYLRDSLGYLLDTKNQVFFSPYDFDTTLIFIDSNPLFEMSIMMTDKNFLIDVPYGTFTTINQQTKYQFIDHPIPPPADQDGIMYLNRRCAKDVGIVLENQMAFISSDYYYERRLTDYSISD